MSDDLSPEALAVKIATDQAERLLSAAKSITTKVSNSVKARLESTFSSYLASIYRKHSSTKTLIYRETPKPLLTFYEPVGLCNQSSQLDDPTLSRLAQLSQQILITGTGGSGKSTLLKYLLLNSLAYDSYIPIFVELRQLEGSGSTLLKYIAELLKLHAVKLPDEFLTAAFSHGHFALLLDGFDELSAERAREVALEIENFTIAHPETLVVVTSRAGEDFRSWQNFVELHPKALTLEKACSLIEKLEIEDGLKKRFIRDLKGGLFKSHSSFFENPLLLSIMLLTYQDSAAIPAQLHSFYSLAFDALFFRHDASKSSFRRPTLTSISIDQGRDLMSGLAISSYLDEKFTFSRIELLNYIEDAKRLSNLAYGSGELLKDLTSAFCMLVQDGNSYSYTHRSFQEYFSARYFVMTDPNEQKGLAARFEDRLQQDATLRLAFGMNQKLVERLVVLPFLRWIISHGIVGTSISKEGFYSILEATFERVRFEKGSDKSISTLHINQISKTNRERLRRASLLRFLVKNYPEAFASKDQRSRTDAIKGLLNHFGERKENSISALKSSGTWADTFFETSWFRTQIESAIRLKSEIETRHAEQANSLLTKLGKADVSRKRGK